MRAARTVHVKRASAACSGQSRERLTAARAPRHAGEQAAECRPLRRRPGVCRRRRRRGYVVFANKRQRFWAASRAHGRAGPRVPARKPRAPVRRDSTSSHRDGKGCSSMIPVLLHFILPFGFQPLYRDRARKERTLETFTYRRSSERTACKELPRWSVHSCTSLAFECSTNRGAGGLQIQERMQIFPVERVQILPASVH